MPYFFSDHYKALLISIIFIYTLSYAQEKRVRFEHIVISPIDNRATSYCSRPNSKGHLDWCIRIAQQRNDEEKKQRTKSKK